MVRFLYNLLFVSVLAAVTYSCHHMQTPEESWPIPNGAISELSALLPLSASRTSESLSQSNDPLRGSGTVALKVESKNQYKQNSKLSGRKTGSVSPKNVNHLREKQEQFSSASMAGEDLVQKNEEQISKERVEAENNEIRNLASIDEPKDLIIQPKLSFGGNYLGIKQNGAFGGGEGTGVSINKVGFETKAIYGKWNLTAAFERLAVQFSRDVANTSLKETKKLQNILIEGGYGCFFAGVNAKTTPLMHISGTTIQWGDVNGAYAMAGARLEKKYEEGREKPFKLGVEGKMSYLVRGKGSGPTLSSASGHSGEVEGYVEKAILRREDYELIFGLEGKGGYDQLKVNGTWNGSLGETKRTLWNLGIAFSLGAKF